MGAPRAPDRRKHPPPALLGSYLKGDDPGDLERPPPMGCTNCATFGLAARTSIVRLSERLASGSRQGGRRGGRCEE